MSRLLPALVARRTTRELGLELGLPDAHLDAVIARGLRRLYAFQHRDGGWGWWQHDPTDARMTAYVCVGLALARRAGIDVPPDILRRASAALVDLESTPYVVYARHQLLDLVPDAVDTKDGVAAALERAAAQATPDEIAYLVLAGREDLVDKLPAAPPERVTWRATERAAWTLRALRAARPADPRLVVLRDWLLDIRRGARWQTTLDTAHAVVALSTLIAPGAPEPAVQVTVNGQPIAIERGAASLGDDDLRAVNTVVVRATGERPAGSPPLRATARLRFVARGTLEVTRASGLRVRRALQRLDAARPAPAEAWDGEDDPRWAAHDGRPMAVGERMRVVVDVAPDERTDARFVMIEVPIPAGTEPILRDDDQPGGARDTWYQRRDQRDDRILVAARRLDHPQRLVFYLRATHPGRYRVLPTEAWGMYDTEVRGRSAATEVVIEK